jgi:1,4-alpha-glucan branching enzyme
MPILVSAVLLLLAGDVQWAGVSHVGWLDRRPLCPIGGEAFDVYFQNYRFDITAARVSVNDGATQWVDAVYDHDRGPYAVWRATIPATAAAQLRYFIELRDEDDVDYYSASGMSDAPPADGGFLIDFATLAHAPLGCTPATGGAVFHVWAPNATQAYVRGVFNTWGLGNPMSRVGENFVAQVAGASAGQEYKVYFEPGAVWKPDARARRFNPAGGNYNSYVVNPLSYVWTTTAYAPPAFEDLIVYEAHVGTFAGRNDPQASGAIPATYRDLAAHAAHLAELGVNAVELMPINEFPGDFSVGYNPISMWALEWRYGTVNDFKYMVDTLHQHGIAVLLDIVWNHFSGSDNFLWNYDSPTQQIYFRVPDAQTPWGSQADFSRGPVREYFRDSALLWLDEYRVDGFRMDATDFMNRFPQEAEGWSLMQWLNDTMDNRAVDKICIAEQLPNDDWITRPTALGGAGFDAQWHDAFTDTLRGCVLDAAFGNPSMAALASAINGSGSYTFGRRVLNYLELHDEAGSGSGGQRLVTIIDTTAPHNDHWARGRIKLAQGLVLLSPGIPAILMGSEWLDPTNVGGGNAGGGDRIDWSLKTLNASTFQFFKDAIATRKDNAAFRANAGWQVFRVDDAANVLAFQRYDASGNVCVVVGSFNNADLLSYRVGLPQAGTWQEILNSQAAMYEGNGVGNGGAIVSEPTAWDGFPQSAAINIPQMGLLVFRWSLAPACPGDTDGDDDVDLADLSRLLANFGGAGGLSDGDIDGDGDVDLSDLSLLLGNFGANC